jgi:hypothetical protein
LLPSGAWFLSAEANAGGTGFAEDTEDHLDRAHGSSSVLAESGYTPALQWVVNQSPIDLPGRGHMIDNRWKHLGYRHLQKIGN